MIIDFRLEIFKVEGKGYIICLNHEILFMLFRPLVLYLNVVVYGEYTDSCKLPSASITGTRNYSKIEQQQCIQRSLTTKHRTLIGIKIWKKIRDGKISGG